MKTATTKSKWKAWHIIVLIVIVGIGFLAKTMFNKLDAIEAAQNDPKEIRNNLIKKSFSEWDGTSIALVKSVKDNMNDPASFELVDNKVWDNGHDTLVVKMKYRGKNAFGGKVTEMVRAEVDINGNVLKITKE